MFIMYLHDIVMHMQAALCLIETISKAKKKIQKLQGERIQVQTDQRVSCLGTHPFLPQRQVSPTQGTYSPPP